MEKILEIKITPYDFPVTRSPGCGGGACGSGCGGGCGGGGFSFIK